VFDANTPFGKPGEKQVKKRKSRTKEGNVQAIEETRTDKRRTLREREIDNALKDIEASFDELFMEILDEFDEGP
jgi:hypothetical protein